MHHMRTEHIGKGVDKKNGEIENDDDNTAAKCNTDKKQQTEKR